VPRRSVLDDDAAVPDVVPDEVDRTVGPERDLAVVLQQIRPPCARGDDDRLTVALAAVVRRCEEERREGAAGDALLVARPGQVDGAGAGAARGVDCYPRLVVGRHLRQVRRQRTAGNRWLAEEMARQRGRTAGSYERSEAWAAGRSSVGADVVPKCALTLYV